MPTPSNKKSEFDRVWKVTDYGNVDALLRLSANGGGGTSAAVGADGRTLFPEGMSSGISTTVVNGKVAPTDAVKATAQEILNDPQAFVDKNISAEAAVANDNLYEKGKSFLSGLFDTSDTWDDGEFSGEVSGESVWDTFLIGYMWTTERINQVTVAGLSALPGGTRTLTWGEAGDVSVGQQLIANVGVSTGDVRRGEGNLGDAFALAASGIYGGIGFLAPDSGTQKEGFDISSEEDRKVFDEGWEKFGSGALDTAFTIFADPFIIAGKALKVTRLKYIDRPLTAKNVQKITKEIDDGAALYATGDMSKAAPIAQLVSDAVTRRVDGSRMPTREAMLRAEVKWGDNAEGIADALTTLPDGAYDLGALVVKAGLGNAPAIQELSRRSLVAADTLVNAKRQQLADYIALDPKMYLIKMEKATLIRDRAIAVLEAQKKQLDDGLTTPDVVAAAQKTVDDSLDDVLALTEGRVRDGLSAPDQSAMQLVVQMVKEAERDNDWFAKVLSDSRGEGVPRFYTSSSGAYKGIASNTGVGRFVSKRRAKKARADYERKSTSQQRVKATDYFGANRFQRTIRVFKRMSDEMPAYYVNIASDVDQGREVGAILDTLAVYSGAGKEITNKFGNVVTVGGIARKDELFTMYTSARSLGAPVEAALVKIQTSIRDDLADFYNFDREMAEKLTKKAFNRQVQLKQQIQTEKKGYFMDGEPGEVSRLNVAPFLNTQLSNGMYFLPWDTFETVLKNIAAGKIPEWQTGALRTKPGIAKDKLQLGNEIFQDFWRPAVLFRLGYTQRNLTEGLFRSIAYNGTFEPLLYAGKAAVNTRANFRRVQRAEREFSKLQKQIDTPDAARDKFDGLAHAQRELHDAENWLMGAKGRLKSAALRVFEAQKPPVIAFSEDINVLPIVSDDGAFQIVKQVAPASSAPSVTAAAPLALKWKTQSGQWESAQGYVITKSSKSAARASADESWDWTPDVRETTFKVFLPYGELVTQTFKSLKEAKAYVANRAVADASQTTPTVPGNAVKISFPNPTMGSGGIAEAFSAEGYKLSVATKPELIIGSNNQYRDVFAYYIVKAPDGVQISGRRKVQTIEDVNKIASDHATNAATNSSPAAPTLKWEMSRGGGRYEADGYGIERFRETTTSTATMRGVTVTEWGVSLPSGVPVTQTFKTLKEAKAYVANRAAADAAGAAPSVTKYVVNQLDTTDNATFIPGTGGRLFDSPADAALAVEKAVADAFAGKIIAGPQFEKIYLMGKRARAMSVKSEKSPLGVEYLDIDSIDQALAKLANEGKSIADEIDAIGPRPASKAIKSKKFQTWRKERLDNEQAAIDDAVAHEAWLEDLIKAGGASLDTYADNLQLQRQIREGNETYRVALERDDMFALTEYTAQASARRTTSNGTKLAVTPGIVLESAFGDPLTREMAWRNMSANNTVKATIALRNNTTERLLYDVKATVYVNVLPSDGAAYWNGMARMLQQYSLSNMGKMILKGDTDDQIAAWLLSPAGKGLRESLDDAYAVGMGKDALISEPRIGNSIGRATDFVAEVRMGLEEITHGNKDVWTVMRSHAPTAAELQVMMKDMKNLGPVVGTTEEITGVNTLMTMWRKATERGFENIGTKPEDAFVRGPFYDKAFVAERDKRLAVLYSQFATRDEVPLKLVYAIQEASHRFAVKATKDWLYTIDRRTKLGTYGETMFPFISAAQNSLTALGRLSYRDPSVPAALTLIWQAPTKLGWEDKEGNLLIPIPHDLIPDGVEDAIGIAGLEYATISKGSVNVIFPESGAGFIPRPTPLVQAAASSLMVQGLFGAFGPEAPAPLVAVFGEQAADKTWQYMKEYMFSEDGGVSTELFSYDKLLPPIANKLIQYIQQDGSSAYGYQYALQARTQELLWRAGERPDYPKPDEIMRRTNGIFILRMLGNALAFTPPNYQSPLKPLMDAQRAYDEAYGLEGPMKFSENFGNETMILSDTNSTRNVGGITSNPGTVRNIRKYDSLIREVANFVGEDLDVMGLIVNEDMKNSFYDANSARWMLTTNVPGTSRTWREVQTGGESMAESQRQAGWVEYIKFKGQLDALLQEQGLKTYSNKGAEALNSYRKEFINNMINNPMYEGWAVDFQSTGSSKTYSAVKTIETVLNDDTFMSDNADNRTWQIASEYIDTRNRLIQLVQESGVTLENNVNQVLKDQWDEYRQSLIDRDDGWAGIANRYLNGDDNPTAIGGSFMTEGM